MRSFVYDAGFDPPAPAVVVRVSAPGAADRVQLQALADTGADITVVPAAVAERVLAAIGVVRLQGVGGEHNDAPLYRAAVDIDGVVDVFEVVGWRDETIVGRDVLNRWVATFDGPRGVLELEPR